MLHAWLNLLQYIRITFTMSELLHVMIFMLAPRFHSKRRIMAELQAGLTRVGFFFFLSIGGFYVQPSVFTIQGEQGTNGPIVSHV